MCLTKCLLGIARETIGHCARVPSLKKKTTKSK